MLEHKVVNLRVGDFLREKLTDRSLSSGLKNPIPEIIWGRWEDEEEDSYSIGFHERDELPTNDPIRIIEADGIDFLIIQDRICKELEGKTLDIVNGKLSLF